jgi:hypothetical protein
MSEIGRWILVEDSEKEVYGWKAIVGRVLKSKEMARNTEDSLKERVYDDCKGDPVVKAVMAYEMLGIDGRGAYSGYSGCRVSEYAGSLIDGTYKIAKESCDNGYIGNLFAECIGIGLKAAFTEFEEAVWPDSLINTKSRNVLGEDISAVRKKKTVSGFLGLLKSYVEGMGKNVEDTDKSGVEKYLLNGIWVFNDRKLGVSLEKMSNYISSEDKVWIINVIGSMIYEGIFCSGWSRGIVLGLIDICIGVGGKVETMDMVLEEAYSDRRGYAKQGEALDYIASLEKEYHRKYGDKEVSG